MGQDDIRSAQRPDPDPPMVDVADYVVASIPPRPMTPPAWSCWIRWPARCWP